MDYSYINTDKEKEVDPDKWFWMMDYCKMHTLPPAHDWAWAIAEN